MYFQIMKAKLLAHTVMWRYWFIVIKSRARHKTFFLTGFMSVTQFVTNNRYSQIIKTFQCRRNWLRFTKFVDIFNENKTSHSKNHLILFWIKYKIGTCSRSSCHNEHSQLSYGEFKHTQRIWEDQSMTKFLEKSILVLTFGHRLMAFIIYH